MAIQSSRSLAEFFERRAGSHLRLVAHYEPADVEFVYTREDLDATYSDETFEESFEMHRRDQAAATHQADSLAVGDHHCTLRIYDEAIVFNFAQTDDVGTVVSLDPAVGTDLLSFVTTSLQELHENSPQRVEAPTWVQE